jgi:hypothetical protein
MHDHNLAYIAHPKTASSATQRVLRAMGAKIYGNHHSVDGQWCRPILESGGVIISTIRNPFDLLVSWYFHYAQRRPNQVMEPFSKWLPWLVANPNDYIKRGLFFGLPWTTHVVRYENLQEDFNAALIAADLPPTTLESFNVSHKREGRPYQEMYDSDLIHLVWANFRNDIIDNGYTFEETS